MSLSNLAVFALAYFVAVATPGPGVAAIVARALGRGLAGLPAFILGFVLGDLTLYAIAAAGLAVIAQTYAPLFLVIKWAGAAYLVYLGGKMMLSKASKAEADSRIKGETSFSLFLTTYALVLGNPKPIMFFLAVLPLIVDLNTLSFIGFVEIAIVIVLVIAPTMIGYAVLASQARKLFKSETALTRINRFTGAVLVFAGVAIAFT
jgi:threonine/homoserine/homoserine lactone efflux protein